MLWSHRMSDKKLKETKEYTFIEDYVHSANALFHFVKESKYLIDDLSRKALCPRYCNEDVKYLQIRNGDEEFKEISILQKCFCDIPLRNILRPFPVKLTDNNKDLSDEQVKLIPSNQNHTDLYGKYAIAFSKSWGERSKLQPIHYLCDESECVISFSKMIAASLSENELPDVVADSMINWLCYLKPLRGTMHRRIETENHEKIDIEIYKNFHDEHEWRYVPFTVSRVDPQIDYLIAAKKLIERPELLRKMSDTINDTKFKNAWLPFQYDDIRYIIVPDNNGRIEIINAIRSFDTSLFYGDDIELQKSILISKILLLDDIKKDF